MKYDEALWLEVGDVVTWDRQPPLQGRVTEVGATGFRVRWEDGLLGWTPFFDADAIRFVGHQSELPFTDPPEGGERPHGQEAGDGTY